MYLPPIITQILISSSPLTISELST
jgi:hypothetical protein